MLGRRKARNQQLSPYATRSEFCRIFERDMSSLYLLAFLLTGDHTMAEHCFVGGLHIAQEGNHVFKEWAESWARRVVLQNAIRMIRPRKIADGADQVIDPGKGSPAKVHAMNERPEIAGIVALPAFERFVFVMSVLERYSDQECSLLLGCARGDVAAARTRALERMGRFNDLHRESLSIGSNQEMRRESFGSEPAQTAVSGLALSA